MDRLDQLLKMLETVRKEERSLVDDLSAEERDQMGTPEEWSFKDNVAHYTVWRRRLTENLAAIAAGRTPEWKEWYLETEERNRAIFDEYQSQSFEEIQAFSATTLSDLIEAVRSVEHELETVGLNPPSRRERPLWWYIAANSYSHPMLHLITCAHKREDTARHRQLNLTLAEQSLALDDSPPWQAGTNYNLACYYSMAGETEKAIELLRSALIMSSQSRIDWSRKDPDLDPIRSDPAYQQIYTDLETDT
jgi:hypothetical protein